MISIAGVTVLYNPEEKVLENIKSYLDQVSLLFIIDNSENPDNKITEKLKNNEKVVYRANNDNFGIARALNQGAELALNHNIDWLLTMDQDSYFDKEMISSYISSIKELENKYAIGVAACNFCHPDLYSGISFNESPEYKLLLDNLRDGASRFDDNYSEIFLAITSGSLINLDIYKKVGGFEEKLFIDQVDHDYCLKVKSNGYKVIMFNNIYLNHNLGSMKRLNKILPNFPNSNFMCSHSPKRLYYKSRNLLYLFKAYHKAFPAFIVNMIFREMYTFTFNLAFDNDKISRIQNISKGIYHFCINRYGK